MSKEQTRKLLTPFGEKLDKNSVLPEYPRPQMTRNSYLNLNGIWNYSISKKDEEKESFDGEIVVPFPPEALLSGVNKVLKEDELLRYQRTFDIPKDFINERTLLNFGAVDYSCIVWLNGMEIGRHKGGYTPFTLDATKAIKVGSNNLYIEVTDPSNYGIQARGKQTLKPGGIWYTPISGIWQTVWLESVPNAYVKNVRITPNIDKGFVAFDVDFVEDAASKSFFMCGSIKIYDKGNLIAESSLAKDVTAIIKLSSFTLWTPENPYLYDVEITVNKDTVRSYFGMRKFSIGEDKKGVKRLMLNNKPYFHNGLLDQGYWSDGLYSPPSDEAMIYDIQTMKDMGFNMLRKHIKIEPMRWYYHCDKIGMLVWQDMVSGGDSDYSFLTIGAKPFFSLLFNKRHLGMMDDKEVNYKKFRRASKEGREEYYRDMYATMDTLMNVVSLALWVPFNEGWGQFDSIKAAEKIRAYDPTRLIDHASGWHDQGGVDLNSYHIYFTPYRFSKYDVSDDRPIAISEFGGFSHFVEGHTFSNKIFGYRVYKTLQKLGDMYEKLFDDNIISNIDKGLSATVYTQVSDVECEINGLLTYDRRVVKIPIERMQKINAKVVIKEE